ncbi:MAG: 3'-5' exonuclease [Actinomycetota bacterium]|nr:3'-5' exonuclease [Actinomycetota bacterium]
MNSRLTAIDFETANEKLSSACALGMAIIEDNKIIKNMHWLIKPPELYFRPFNTYIHGISEKDVKKKPEFFRLWPTIKKYLEGNIVIAHNASFDTEVLRKLLDVYQLDYPELSYACTVNLSRKVWKNFENYKLDTVAGHLNFSFRHHNARDDAMACAKIAIEASKKMQANDFDELMKKINLKTTKFEKRLKVNITQIRSDHTTKN